MKGITFGRYHTYRDFNLILSGKEMGAQTVKSKKLDIDGADGSLDMTDFFGEPKYENVTHRFDFSTIVPQSEFLSLYSRIKNAIHGKKMGIILDDDPHYSWLGRCYVSRHTNEKNVGIITVECDCEPYKYKISQTSVIRAVTGTTIITLTNGRRRAVPKITTTAPMTIAFGTISRAASAGTFEIPELELTEGENRVTVTGTGTITFTWQEGSL